MARQPERLGGRRHPHVEWVVRALVVTALAVEAGLHLHLAEAMQLAAPAGIGGGTLFRAQAGIALVAGVLLLATGSRLGYLLAGVAALSALVPVLLYSFVNVPALGPIPSLYDPTWYPAKIATVIAEVVAVVLCVVGFVLAGRRRSVPMAADGRRRTGPGG